MARRIESYYLWFGEDISSLERFSFYLELYNKILKKDSKWHFFTEGRYDELRFDSKFKRRVNRFIEKDYRIKTSSSRSNGWVDDQRIVEEHKEYFTEIFHQNTLLAIRLFAGTTENYTDESLKSIMDRVVHSFFNMINLFTLSSTLEARVMSSYVLDRAWYTGYLTGIEQERSKHE